MTTEDERVGPPGYGTAGSLSEFEGYAPRLGCGPLRTDSTATVDLRSGNFRGLFSAPNVPASLADVCLVPMAESCDQSLILTLVADFNTYRKHKRKIIPLLVSPATKMCRAGISRSDPDKGGRRNAFQFKVIMGCTGS